ncbi:MAG: hypothetical protein ACRDKE_04635 [Solirubrobacterales bacterium]
MNLDKQQKTRLAVALGVVVALVLGFSALNKSDSQSVANANAAMQGPSGQGGPPGGGQGGPGQMEAVTGAAATKAKAAAEAKVDGTAQQVMKNPRGSGYVVLVLTDDGTPTLVEVNTAFKVTATRETGQGGPPAGAPQAQGTSS